MTLLDGTWTRSELADHLTASQGVSRDKASRKVDESIKDFAGYALLRA
jgi:hypothetical protein